MCAQQIMRATHTHTHTNIHTCTHMCTRTHTFRISCACLRASTLGHPLPRREPAGRGRGRDEGGMIFGFGGAAPPSPYKAGLGTAAGPRAGLGGV